MKIEVRAVGLKAMREKRGLTQRKLAHDLGISQNYIPAIEARARHAGPRLPQQMVKYFGCAFGDLFEVVLSRDLGGAGAWRSKVMKQFARGAAARIKKHAGPATRLATPELAASSTGG